MPEGALRIEELLGNYVELRRGNQTQSTQDNKEREYDRRSPISVRDKLQI
jgi:hypothetical protein